MQMIEEKISNIDKKLEDIETILETFSAQSWDEHRRGKVGVFYVYSLDQLIEKKRQLREENSQLRRRQKNLLLAQKSSPAATSSSDNIYYQVNASIEDSKTKKGFRASMYRCAQNCHAHYSQHGHDKTIYYEEGSNDLSVHLLFITIHDAQDFQNALINFAMEHSRFKRRLKIEKDIIQVKSIAKPSRVFYFDYKPEDNNDSPYMSLNDILSDSYSVISISNNPSLALQALEGVRSVAIMCSKWYKCYLISAKNKEYEKDPDNIIYVSSMFHQLFDGSNTVYGIGVVVRFEKFLCEEEVAVNDKYERRYKLEVVIEFRDSHLAYTFEHILKDGTKRLNETSFLSFLYARDAERMKLCLDAKYEETKQIWNAELMDT